MAEHGRVEDYAGNRYQWVDEELVMVLDVVTGEAQRFGPHANAIGRLDDALELARRSPQAPPRFVIVKLACIASHKLIG